MPTTDKDLPLREDSRLLGRLLGNIVRDREGEDGFALVEHIRQTSVLLSHSADSGLEPEKRAEFEAFLNGLPRNSMVSVVRVSLYF